MTAISYLQNIYWREPLWLLIALQPLVIVLLKSLIQQNDISLYVEKKLQPWVVFPAQSSMSKNIFSKNSAYLLAWLFFSIALAGPRTPLTQADKEQFYGANIMLVVDLSRSMHAMDIKPNRLHRAKTEIYEFLELAQDHRIGITVYSARPHLLVPLTSDHAVLQNYIESIDKLSFPTLGSDPINAILFAQKELTSKKGNSAIVLITDGDFNEFSDTQISKLKEQNIPLYILGLGTPEGEAIPLGDGTWLKNKEQYVVSKMNINVLKKISSQLNGLYSPVYDDISDWNLLYQNGISRHNVSAKTDGKKQILWNEDFSFFLAISIFLFFISLNTYRFKRNKNNITLALACMFLISIPNKEVHALEIGQTNEQAGYRAYVKKDYHAAEKLYKNIDLSRIYFSYFGQGNSLYKMGHYQKAIQQFIFAAINANTDNQRANSLYNLGNSYFRTGDFPSAIRTYKDALRYQQNNKAFLHNIKISQILENNLKQRLKEKQRILSLSRQGNGPRSARIADGTEINENTSISMGDGQNRLNDNIPLPDLPNTDEATIKKILLSGLKNIQLANKNNSSIIQYKAKNNSNVEIIKAKQKSNSLSDSQYLLWKRLFEIEEGFPAPVKKPRTVPGVKPW